MFRSTALRSLPRSLPSCNASVARPTWRRAIFRAQLATQAPVGKSSKRLSIAIRKPLSTALVRYQSSVDKAAEAEYRKAKLQAQPETVSAGSSVRHVAGEITPDDPDADVDMMAGIKSDFVCSKPARGALLT
jgi:hypothetical protein